ncbi:hypothetical protein LTR06_011358 [Exophiala xenobiotica]|nr:hypothetical protein LTR06_011358 [Exophiala xenobiotica]
MVENVLAPAPTKKRAASMPANEGVVAHAMSPAIKIFPRSPRAVDWDPRGMGGQGKSQIAPEFCRQWRTRYAEIFWLNASSETTAVQSLERVAAEIGQPTTGVEDARTRIRLLVHALGRRCERRLMMLDNYDDPDQVATIEHSIPSYGLGDILITTSQQRAGRTGTGADSGVHDATERDRAALTRPSNV